jgi:hypothetical protein
MSIFRNSYGWFIPLIAGFIIAIILKQPISASTLIYPLIIGVVAIMSLLIGFYIDYQASYEYRDKEPVLAGCIVSNAIALIIGLVFTLILIIIGGI